MCVGPNPSRESQGLSPIPVNNQEANSWPINSHFGGGKTTFRLYWGDSMSNQGEKYQIFFWGILIKKIKSI